MMGRLKVIASHCRNSNMLMTQKTIKYEIPLYSEKDKLGNISSFEVRDNEIVLVFNVKEDEQTKLPVVVNKATMSPDLVVNFN